MRVTISIMIFFLVLIMVPVYGITIGMSTALTGPSQDLGLQLSQTAQLYFSSSPLPITLILYDDHYDPAPALYNTVKFITEDKVDLLYGYLGTAPVTYVLPLLKCYEQDNIRFFFPFTGAEPQRTPPYNAYTYNFRASYFDETKALVDLLVATGHRRIAILYQSDPYGRNGWEGVKKALDSHGLPLVAEATYLRESRFEESYKAQVRILSTQKPDAIIVIGVYAPSAGFIRDCREAGVDIPIANVSFVGANDVQKLLKEAHTKRLIFSQVVPNYEDSELPAVMEYKALIQGTSLRPSFVGFEGFLSAKLLVEILKKVPPPFTKGKLLQVLHDTHTYYLGIDSPVQLGDRHRQGMHQVYFTTIQDGKFVTIKEWSQWQK